MIPYSAVQGIATLRGQLSTAAVADLDRMLRGLADESLAVQREALMDLLPELGDQYAYATSLLSAEFFAELAEMSGIPNVEPETLDGLDRNRWQSLAGWGSRGSVLERGGNMLMFSLLSGGLTRALSEMAADTMIGNAEKVNAQQGKSVMGFQRVPAPGCCAFCGLLASRFADYGSAESAGRVVGRGAPLGSHRLAKGIRPRGSRKVGEKFHDFCRCEIVAVTPANAVQMQADAERYYDAYRDGKEKATGKLERNVTTSMRKDGTRYNEYEWVDEAGDSFKSDNALTKRIVAEMRSDLGVK